ncbi:hypothetical protein P7228_12810 [Altererythrobacter arenosus]|uniref:Uncharacterized protein n=1 Tax=Altererythrobacter arenosus TaxID=3032592 RepID=A0ABY8FQ21_9SPHN|nr:hypothetical protein [Altererythrobacter sp. CAU 1644]WFL76867.1 hypothetical protein P7228_12810 [Altererythrobacter sp. CAU 1644]
MRISVLLALFATFFATGAFAQPWKVGDEREVDEGYYLTLLSSESGWRVWQIETREGIRCSAVKSAEGKPHPEPIGVADHFWRGTPYLVVSKGHQFGSLGRIWRFRLQGVHGKGQKTQFRKVGDRFWTDWKHSLDLSPMAGERIEVAISSYEYPHSLVGGAHEKGVLDLDGLSKVVEAVEACGTLDY